MSGAPDEFRARVFEALLKTGKTVPDHLDADLVNEVLHEMKWPYWKGLTYWAKVNDHQIQCVLCGDIIWRWAAYTGKVPSAEHEKLHFAQVRWVLYGRSMHPLMTEPAWEHTGFPTELVHTENA